jgi:hypothetical protein
MTTLALTIVGLAMFGAIVYNKVYGPNYYAMARSYMKGS